MPNGGSDCCGTCWFNSTHEGVAGLIRDTAGQTVRCTIRDLTIEVPFWTYCVNHPHHNPDRVAVPVGPAYQDAGGFPYRREILAQSPDTEEIRKTLLGLLAAIQETPRAEYPTSPTFDEAVVYQVMQFRDARAVPQLQRIVRFNPLSTNTEGKFAPDRVGVVGLAISALAAILNDEAADTLKAFVRMGRETVAATQPYSRATDRLGFIRYKALEGAAYCSDLVQAQIASLAVADPDDEIATLANQMLSTNRAG